MDSEQYPVFSQRKRRSDFSVNEVSRKLLDKAARALAAAERDLKSRDTEGAVARAYYVMFYSAEALLTAKSLKFKKHGGVHGAFGEHFAKTGILDSKFHRWILDAFDRRVTADYGIENILSLKDAEETIFQAKEFLEISQKYLQTLF